MVHHSYHIFYSLCLSHRDKFVVRACLVDSVPLWVVTKFICYLFNINRSAAISCEVSLSSSFTFLWPGLSFQSKLWRLVVQSLCSCCIGLLGIPQAGSGPVTSDPAFASQSACSFPYLVVKMFSICILSRNYKPTNCLPICSHHVYHSNL